MISAEKDKLDRLYSYCWLNIRYFVLKSNFERLVAIKCNFERAMIPLDPTRFPPEIFTSYYVS